jgi:hypothetical protein
MLKLKSLLRQVGIKEPKLIKGYGPPTDDIGNRWDVYLDIDANMCYEAKGDSWGNPISLVETGHPLLVKTLITMVIQDLKKRRVQKVGLPIPAQYTPSKDYPIPSEEES